MANTQVELKLQLTNGTCNLTPGMYGFTEPLRIEIKANELYGNNTKPPQITYAYIKTGIGFNSSIMLESETEVGTWYFDLTWQYYFFKDEDMFMFIKYDFVRKYARINNSITHCITNCPDGLYALTKTKIHLTADSGYEFKVTPYVTYYAYDKSALPWKWLLLEFPMNRISETDYEIEITLATDNETYTLYGEAIKSTIITDKYGLLAVYKPTQEELHNISLGRFITPKPVTVGGTVPIVIMKEEYIDTAKYAISLHRLYFNIESGDKENVYFGPYNTEIQCDSISNDIVTLNLGSVDIYGRHKNSIDYKNTQIEIYLPFVGFTTLDTADFMDKELSLIYQINILNGETLIILYSAGNIMYTTSCNVSYKIPFMLNDREYTNTQLQPNTNYLLNTAPFVYIKSYNAENPDEHKPYNTTNIYAKFGDLTGYTEALEIDFEPISDQITKTEIDEIKSIIESGVFL